MLVTLGVWLIAVSAAWGYGDLFFRPESGQPNLSHMDPEDVTIRLYFGVFLISFSLLASALITNISWWLGLTLSAPGIVIAALHLNKTYLRSTTGGTFYSKWSYLFFGSGLLILAFFVSATEVQFFDTGRYHQQMAKWLSDFGLVPGLAMLQKCFGWTSSWFAAAATLNHGPLRGREAAIIGGLPFALMIMSTATVAWRCKLGGVLPAVRGLTWSLFCGFLVVVSIAWSVESSLSPDIVIWLLPVLIALVLSEQSTSKHDRVGLALLFSSLILTVKLSAVPIVGYCGVLWLWQFARVRTGRKSLLACLGLAMMVAFVLAAANIRTSGCPLYPSPIGCTSGESSVGGAFAAGVDKEVREYAVEGNRHVGWFVIAALAGTIVSLKTRGNDPFVRHGLALSWSGIIFLLLTAPNPRFGMGYLVLPVAMGLALLIHMTNRKRPTLLATVARSVPWVTAAVALLFLALSFHAPNWRFSLLLPQRMASADGDPIHVVNQDLNMRTTLSLTKVKLGRVLAQRAQFPWQCWDAPSLALGRHGRASSLETRHWACEEDFDGHQPPCNQGFPS